MSQFQWIFNILIIVPMCYLDVVVSKLESIGSGSVMRGLCSTLATVLTAAMPSGIKIKTLILRLVMQWTSQLKKVDRRDS